MLLEYFDEGFESCIEWYVLDFDIGILKKKLSFKSSVFLMVIISIGNRNQQWLVVFILSEICSDTRDFFF